LIDVELTENVEVVEDKVKECRVCGAPVYEYRTRPILANGKVDEEDWMFMGEKWTCPHRHEQVFSTLIFNDYKQVCECSNCGVEVSYHVVREMELYVPPVKLKPFEVLSESLIMKHCLDNDKKYDYNRLKETPAKFGKCPKCRVQFKSKEIRPRM
jgi:hypothetical protein